jgi:TonB family protein
MQRLLVFYIAIAALASPLIARSSGSREYAVYAKPPEYPAAAKERHLTGSGAFALHIRLDGTVERVETLKSIGHRSLDHAAITAFREWRFRPHRAGWILRVPIRYVDGPPQVDELMRRAPSPGYTALVTVFSHSE